MKINKSISKEDDLFNGMSDDTSSISESISTFQREFTTNSDGGIQPTHEPMINARLSEGEETDGENEKTFVRCISGTSVTPTRVYEAEIVRGRNTKYRIRIKGSNGRIKVLLCKSRNFEEATEADLIQQTNMDAENAIREKNKWVVGHKLYLVTKGLELKETKVQGTYETCGLNVIVDGRLIPYQNIDRGFIPVMMLSDYMTTNRQNEARDEFYEDYEDEDYGENGYVRPRARVSTSKQLAVFGSKEAATSFLSSKLTERLSQLN